MSNVYKIAKTLCLRLNEVLHRIIDYTQSTFLKGRVMLDSVLVDNETIEDVRRKI